MGYLEQLKILEGAYPPTDKTDKSHLDPPSVSNVSAPPGPSENFTGGSRPSGNHEKDAPRIRAGGWQEQLRQALRRENPQRHVPVELRDRDGLRAIWVNDQDDVTIRMLERDMPIFYFMESKRVDALPLSERRKCYARRQRAMQRELEWRKSQLGKRSKTRGNWLFR